MLPWMSSSPCFEVTLPGGKQPVHALPSESPAVRPSAVLVLWGPFRPVNKKRVFNGQKLSSDIKQNPLLFGFYILT